MRPNDLVSKYAKQPAAEGYTAGRMTVWENVEQNVLTVL